MKVCVFTGTRADFGVLRPLIQKLKDSENFQLQIVALAMHLSPVYGNTYKEIEQNGFEINAKIPTLISGDSSNAINKSIGLAQIGIADALDNLNPELAIILGDRTEMLAAATCCTMANIPIAHIHGGEVTAGAYDDAIRHSITKMSYWHFTSTEEYRNRVIQLGEHPERVINVGAIGLDSIKNLDLLNKKDFEKSINFKLKKHTILVTYHPVTLEKQSTKSQIDSILSALSNYLSDTSIIFTHANSDKDGHIINNSIEEFVQKNPESTKSFKSLGQLRYLSALDHVDIVVGNSSSGIIEVPAFNIPTINIGDRQLGRAMPKSIINVSCNEEEIKSAIEKAFSKSFLNEISKQENIYGNGDASNKIMDYFEHFNWDNVNLKKGFYDLKIQL